MSREKQIEEMVKVIARRSTAFRNPNVAFMTTATKTAESLYNAGYRKQIEGEWENVYNHDTPDGHLQRKTACSICGYKPKGENKTKYCPDCGAHLKGGAE